LETVSAVPSTGEEDDRLGATVFVGAPVTILLTTVLTLELPTELDALMTAWIVFPTSAVIGV
jgi:hypothetical protein